MVSGIKHKVRMMKATFKAAYSQKVPALPKLFNKVKKVAPTIILAIQLVAVETVIPKITTFKRLDF